MDVVQNLYKSLKFEEVNPAPIVFWNIAPWMPSTLGIPCLEYYQNVEKKLHVHETIQKMFPEALQTPGFFPDYGVVVEASAFGSELQWFEDDAPYAHTCLPELSDIDKLKSINPQTDGLMPKVLEEWQYLRKNADQNLLKKYGYIEGHAFCLGPAEVAALLRGYDKYFMDFYDAPQKVHQLMDIVTEGIITWIKAQEKVNGTINRLFMVDHVPTQMNPSHYLEYVHPYIKRIFTEFKSAELRLWHNEGRSAHIKEYIADMGCNIYHFGADSIETMKEVLYGKVALMGNLHSVHIVQKQNPDQIKAATLQCLEEGAAGGGYFVSGAGGFAPGTSAENLRAIVDAVLSYKQEESNLVGKEVS